MPPPADPAVGPATEPRPPDPDAVLAAALAARRSGSGGSDLARRIVAALEARPRKALVVALVAAGVFAVSVGAVLTTRRAPAPATGLRLDEVLPRAGSTTTPRGADPGTVTTVAGHSMWAHAAGAVHSPGLYELPVGARVADLVAAAGGLTPDGDPDRLNLAAPLVDGVRVYVPRHDELAPPPVVAPNGVPSAGSTPTVGAAGSPAGVVDLNRATAAELDALPGVGPATAQAILTWRDEHGRFASVDELEQVRGIGPARLEQLRPLVTVG